MNNNDTRTLSAPDPCPHITRIAVIRTKLSGDGESLESMLDHIARCDGEDRGVTL
jgi:hypothetical protein